MKQHRFVTFIILITVFFASLGNPADVQSASAAFLLANAAPDAPVLGAPANNATNVSANPTLRVRVTDPNADKLTVTFYGRPKGATQNFTIVAIPDTQNYTDLSVVKDGDQKFYKEMQWIADHKSSSNIIYAAGLGDLVQNGNQYESEWTIADTAYSKLEMGTSSGADDVPYGPAVGNHDPLPDMTSFARFEAHFGVARFTGRPYYGGHYSGTGNQNSYYLFSVPGMSFIAINVDCSNGTPDQAIRDWADGLLKSYSGRRGILVCHSLLNIDTSNTDPNYDVTFTSAGTKLYNELKDNPNLFMMLAGHYTGQGRRTDPGDDGHNIYSLLSDFQSTYDGGNGWIRLMEFQPANNLISVKTYSTWIDQYDTSDAGQFTLPYPMKSDFVQIGSPVTVNSGTDATVAWPGLALNTAYEWYAVSSDGSLSTTSSTWSFTTTANNRAPVANSQSVSTAEDTTVPVTLTASDADGDPLSYIVVTGPAHGALSGGGANLTYTPTANFNGSDSFTFKANDGHVDGAAATVSITVTPVNDAPVCNALAMTSPEEVASTLSPSCTDADGDTLTYAIVTGAANGTASIVSGKLKYKGNLNYNGPDSFTYKATDTSSTDSAPATVTVTVTPVNDPPTCQAVSLTTDEDTPGHVAPSCADVDGDTLSYNIVTGAAHGTASVSNGQLAYSPAANYNGPDTFTYAASDGAASSAETTVSVTVNAVNDAPTAQDLNLSTPQDTALAVTLQGSDVENSPLKYSIVSGPQHGALSGTAPNLTYTPAASYYGPDSFSYKVNDGSLDSSTAAVSITVKRVNNPPVANNQNLSTAEDTPLPITLSGSDPDGDPLTFGILSGPSHGTLSGTAPNLIYTPALNYNGGDTFTINAYDGAAYSAAGTITITVTPVNDGPVCSPVTLATDEDTPGQASPGCTDPDGGGPITVSIADQPQHGTAAVADGKLIYTPAANFNGSDSFTYHATDGADFGAPALVTVTVKPVNDAPTCAITTLTLDEDTSIPVPTCSDVDGDPLTYHIVKTPASGTIAPIKGVLSYTPNPNYNGADSFVYEANDGLLPSGETLVNVTVRPVNDAPTCQNMNLHIKKDSTGQVDTHCTDVDGDPLTYEVITNPAHGVVKTDSGVLVYQPQRGYIGSDSFTFRAFDGKVYSESADVSVKVDNANTPPACQAITINVRMNQPYRASPNCTDVNGDPLEIIVVAQPEHGSASVVDGMLVYIPVQEYSGPDGFTYQASDGLDSSSPVSASIEVRRTGVIFLPFTVH